MHKHKKIIQHYTNSMHIYCRLRDLGFSISFSKRASKFYERITHKFLYKRKKHAKSNYYPSSPTGNTYF